MAELTEYVLSNSVPPSVGQITRDDGDLLLVTWDDGHVSNVKRSGNAVRRVRDGSVAALFARDPNGFESWFRADPVEAFVAALKDEGTEAKGAAVQQRLASFGLDLNEVKGAWTKNKKALDRHPHVLAGEARGTVRWSPVARDPESWIDDLSLLGAVKQSTQPKMSAAEKARLDRRLAAMPTSDWPPSEALLGWAVGLETPIPPMSAAPYVQLDDKSLQRVLARAESEHATEVLQLLARLPAQSRTVAQAFEALSPQARWTLGHEALATLAGPADDSAIGSACAVLERLAHGSDPIPDDVGFDCLRLRLAETELSPRVDAALEAFLTATLLPLEALRTELESWQELPLAGVVRGSLEVGSLRLRVLTALLGTRHEDVLRRPVTWAGMGMSAVEDLADRQHPLADVLLAGPDSPGSAVARSWLRSQPSSAATLGRVLGWSRRLREAVPRRDIDDLVAEVRASDDGVRDLLQDPLVPGLQAALASQEEVAQEALTSLTRERDELLERYKTVNDQLEWAHQRMSGAITEADRARESELRQAQIDAVRTLCRVLDAVFEHDEGERVAWSAALDKAASIGVMALGAVGVVVDVDARRHELVDPPARGECVVRRPGYEWAGSEESLVVLRALVSNRQ